MRNVTEQAVHVVNALELREYCESKSAIPFDEHEAFVAFYEITGTSYYNPKSSWSTKISIIITSWSDCSFSAFCFWIWYLTYIFRVLSTQSGPFQELFHFFNNYHFFNRRVSGHTSCDRYLDNKGYDPQVPLPFRAEENAESARSVIYAKTESYSLFCNKTC